MKGITVRDGSRGHWAVAAQDLTTINAVFKQNTEDKFVLYKSLEWLRICSYDLPEKYVCCV